MALDHTAGLEERTQVDVHCDAQPQVYHRLSQQHSVIGLSQITNSRTLIIVPCYEL